MDEGTKVVVVAGSGGQEAAERCRAIIGTRARVLIVDELGDWGEVGLPRPSDELVWCGLDLARLDVGHEVAVRDVRIKIPTSGQLRNELRRTVPYDRR
ncbi:hypothetical protein [Sphingomonas sp. Ag1]|uniref:hypothetical protein n=1 Tax=Sphingomonas sp. Ag1 TaxID=1642949 RepID=UPI0012E03E15|nr:hypothetical protein [Sphingomonas sp. Ag1]